jgi:GDPmannose 4,6-dehydratase
VPDDDIEVWDVNGWVQVTCMTAHIDTPRKTVHRVAAGGAVYHATEDHVVFVCEDGQPVEKPAAEVQVGDQLPLIGMPEPPNIIILSEDEAWLLGVITAIGGIDTGQSAICITTEDQDLLDEVTTCWQRLVKENRISRHTYIDTETQHTVTELYLRNGGSSYVADLCDTLHTKAGDKRVPLRILNASLTSRAAFMDGFEAATGLNPVVETTSATLAAGLYWMAMTSMSQQPSVRTVERDGDLVYQVNLYAGDALLGADQFRELDEVVEARPVEYDGWLYDLATTSETFHAGVGRGWIHNSPRRGLEFVTRKVTYHAAMIKLGLANELRIGNTDSRRDWGFAGDYVQAMWLMLQQDEPDDYVVATGETNTVERLLEVAFDTVDLNWRDHTVQDERFMRPAEVDLLVGDPSKAKAKLTWEPAVSFEELVQMMVESDIQFLKTHHRI